MQLRGKPRFHPAPEGDLEALVGRRIPGGTRQNIMHRWWDPHLCTNETKVHALIRRKNRGKVETMERGVGGEEETLWTLFDLRIWGTSNSITLRSRVEPNVISVTEPN